MHTTLRIQAGRKELLLKADQVFSSFSCDKEATTIQCGETMLASDPNLDAKGAYDTCKSLYSIDFDGVIAAPHPDDAPLNGLDVK